MYSAQTQAKAYYFFINSLPTLPQLAAAKVLPVTGLQLENRLRLLDDAERQTVHQFERTLFGFNFTEAATYAVKAKQLLNLAAALSPQVFAATEHLVQSRVMLGLLRLAVNGKALPTDFKENWAPLLEDQNGLIVAKNWQHPTLGMQVKYPWLSDMRTLLQAGDARSSDELLLGMHEKVLADLAFESTFDFGAVVLYVLRWHILRQAVTHVAEDSVALINAQVEEVVAHVEIPHTEILDEAQ